MRSGYLIKEKENNTKENNGEIKAFKENEKKHNKWFSSTNFVEKSSQPNVDVSFVFQMKKYGQFIFQNSNIQILRKNF